MIRFTFWLYLFSILHFTHSSHQDVWGTFRPHALISARAKVANSPFFGFMYHPADNIDIRHITTDDQDKIRTFSWTRHDGRSFGDQSIQDTAANLLLDTNFLKHSTQNNAWVLRVSAQALDPDKPVKLTSLIFYAAAGPDEVDLEAGDYDRTKAHEWGTLSFGTDNQRTPDGIAADVKILGTASSVGPFQIVLKQPNFGSADPSTLQIAHSSAFSGSGSRGRRRMRKNKPAFESSAIANFHLASGDRDDTAAWAVDHMARQLLMKKRNSKRTSEDSRIDFLPDTWEDTASSLFVQRILQVPFEIEAVFLGSEGRTQSQLENLEKDLTAESLTTQLEERRAAFDRKFESIFSLKQKAVPTEQIEFAKAALSNILGGIGFFFGSSIRKKAHTSAAEKIKLEALPPAGLLTATPSRSRFPRGFLWDEGFHQLVVQKWDPQLSAECLKSWFNLIQDDGWIPREQILGVEARSRFPEHVRHLIVQDPQVANPPTLLLPLRSLALSNRNRSKSEGDETCDSETQDGKCIPVDQSLSYLSVDLLKKAVRYFEWLKGTQGGEISNTFRWRGRSESSKSRDGYPLTLASGLDDYPRAMIVDTSERHVDLHSWITWASGVLSQVSNLNSEDGNQFESDFQRLSASLVEYYGEDISDASNRDSKLLCDYYGKQKVCHEGYVTILPFALGLLSPDDERVSVILDAIEDPLLLRAPAGVRSLSLSDDWYRKGDDYWTGSVWMPFNFLMLAALRTKYSVEDGPYKARAARIFSDLRQDVLNNAFKVFLDTGHFWENYSPDDGTGKSGRQFTGWSSLILLMYADMFEGIL